MTDLVARTALDRRLAEIVRPVLVLSAPGIFEDYPQIDRARRRMSRRFSQQFQRNGYERIDAYLPYELVNWYFTPRSS